MTLLAVAIAGRGLVDPAEPVFRRRRRGASSRRRRVRDDPRLRRPAVPRSTTTSCASASPPRRSRSRRPDGVEELVELVVGAAAPDHVLRLYRTSRGARRDRGGAAAGPRRAARARPDAQELRRRRSTAAPRRREDDELRRLVRRPPRRRARRRRRRAARRRGARARGRDREHLVAARRRALHARRRPGVLPGVTRAFVRSLEPAREGEFALAELLAADEAFLTSSIREVMPVVEIDGAADRRRPSWAGRGAAAGRAQATLRVVSGTVRLGGMALGNGVLVHGPSAWACAVRTDDGVKVVARRKRFRAADVTSPLLRGPARLAEAFALLPQVKRALPEAELPMQRPRVLASLAGSAVVLHVVKRSGLRPAARELVTAVLSSRRPRSRSAAASSPGTTAPSTSRSAPTSTASRDRRSTSGAGRISSARCSSRPRSATSSRSGRRRG